MVTSAEVRLNHSNLLIINGECKCLLDLFHLIKGLDVWLVGQAVLFDFGYCL